MPARAAVNPDLLGGAARSPGPGPGAPRRAFSDPADTPDEFASARRLPKAPLQTGTLRTFHAANPRNGYSLRARRVGFPDVRAALRE